MEKEYSIIYTSVDKQVREFIWKPTNSKVFKGVLAFIEANTWPDENQDEEFKNVYWGIHPRAEYKSYITCTNNTQYEYYANVGSRITYSLGHECVQNEALAKLILREAAVKAKEKDDIRVADLIDRGLEAVAKNYATDYRNALKREKQHIYYRKKRAASAECLYYNDEQASIYASIIEEFSLFTILEVIKNEETDDKK